MKTYGLKVYSTDHHYLREIIGLYNEGVFDYIELYAVPNTLDATGKKWRKIDMPFIIHAAHSSHGMNLAKNSCATNNRRLYREAAGFADLLLAEKIIFHPGIAGEVKETARQLRSFRERRGLIENKPFINLYGKRCVGASYESIKELRQRTGYGLCLDVGHLLKNAYANDLAPLHELSRWLALKPEMIHLNDGTALSCFDDHLSFGRGDFPLANIIEMIKPCKKVAITIETPKIPALWRKDIIRDFKYLAKRLGR